MRYLPRLPSRLKKRLTSQQHHYQNENQVSLNSRYPTQQIRKINIFLLIIFIVASISLTQSIINFSQAISANVTEIKESGEIPTDLIGEVFNSQITTMLLSTFIIAIVGVVINKLRNFKKKFDMVEVIVKVQAKMKRQADEREKLLEDRMTKFEERYGKKIEDIHERIDGAEIKIDNVKNEATKALIDFLSRKKD